MGRTGGEVVSLAWLRSAQIVRLEEAVLCEDCRAVTNAVGRGCLACGSRAVYSLVRLLEGKAEVTFKIPVNPEE